MNEEAIWSAHPRLRALIPLMILCLVISVGGFRVAGPWAQIFINSTAIYIHWTGESVLVFYRAVQGVMLLPLLFLAWKIAVYRTTLFEMTPDRLLYTRGILLRKYDQIRLERVRDFRIFRPLASRLTGTGSVIVVSRDETLPRLTMGPFTEPLGVEKAIREQVLIQQKVSGYREVETT